jgi:hypothetical protein
MLIVYSIPSIAVASIANLKNVLHSSDIPVFRARRDMTITIARRNIIGYIKIKFYFDIAYCILVKVNTIKSLYSFPFNLNLHKQKVTRDYPVTFIKTSSYRITQRKL